MYERLRQLLIETAREERSEIDREIEARTGKYCDVGVNEISDSELRDIVELVRRRRKRVMEAIA